MTARRVNPGQEQQKGDKCSSAEGTFLLVCEAQEGCRRGQVGSGGQLALQLSVQLHRAHPGPKAPAQLQICSRAGAAGALWPRALPWQLSSFCRALIVHPEHALGHHCLFLPAPAWLWPHFQQKSLPQEGDGSNWDKEPASESKCACFASFSHQPIQQPFLHSHCAQLTGTVQQNFPLCPSEFGPLPRGLFKSSLNYMCHNKAQTPSGLTRPYSVHCLDFTGLKPLLSRMLPKASPLSCATDQTFPFSMLM